LLIYLDARSATMRFCARPVVRNSGTVVLGMIGAAGCFQALSEGWPTGTHVI
jgi:hypothetical protein